MRNYLFLQILRKELWLKCTAMCGIHLIVDKRSGSNESAIERMLASTTFRGPDHSSYKRLQWGDATLYIGVNQLRISDPSAFNIQPLELLLGNDQYLLALNGEVYNYHDLKNELSDPDLAFGTGADTEVLLRLVATRGAASIDAVQGMYSLIFIEESTRSITLARDAWGMKPLFYYEDENHLIVSSEVRGIVASNLVETALNEEAVQDYITVKFPFRPNTFYKGIFEFEPGTFRQFKVGVDSELGGPQKITLSTGDDFSQIKSKDEILEFTAGAFSNAVATHWPDGPSAILLSGGVDSTLILATLAELGKRDVHAFCAVSRLDEKTLPRDAHQGKRAARHYGAQYYEVEIGADVLDEFDTYVEKMDQPIADSSEFLTYLVCREVAKQSRVVLSGAGADELFAGYNRHWALRQYLAYPWFRNWVKNPGGIAASAIGALSKDRGRLLRRFFSGLDDSPYQTLANFLSVNEDPEGRVRGRIDMDIEPIDALLKFDRNHYLPSDVLAISDRASMRASIEMRMPYLDQRLSRFALHLPGKTLLLHGRKWILRELLRRKNGKAFADGSKIGFGLPYGYWLNKQLKRHPDNSIIEDSSVLFRFVDRSSFLRTLATHKKGGLDSGAQIWGLLVLAKWLDRHFK